MPAPTPTLLLTGGTGALGRELLPVLLAEGYREVLLLVRPSTRNRTLPLRVAGVRSRAHIRLLTGDVTRRSCALPVRTWRSLTQRVTDILHLAAVTRFDLPLAEARRVNVGGTREILALARACPQLRRVGVISTVYVSGRRTGIVYEHERAHVEGFVNTYEQSKYEAEAIVEAQWRKIPIAVYRLSTILGHSRTGVVEHFTAPHQALRLLHLGLSGVIPGDPGGYIDLLPSDVAARTLAALFLHHFQPQTRFHIAAGPERSFILKEMVDASVRLMARVDPAWRRRQYPTPVIVSPGAFALFRQSVGQARHTLFSQVLATLEHFTEQLCYPKVFDLANTCRALPSYVRDLPHVRAYYGRVIAHCVRTRWGRA